MPDVPDVTAYYFNKKIPAVALIAKGVRLPAGEWIRVASATALAQEVEQMLAEVFPDLKGRVLTFTTLMSEFDVKEFERSLPEPG
jgi:hypothetical protein